MYLGKTTATIIIANKYKLNALNHVEIKKSVHQIVQTAKLRLPLSVVYQNHQALERIKLTDVIKEGDAISIAFGYNGNNNTEFTGYIKRINPKQPLELECEDEMYLFRRVTLIKSFKSNPVADVLKYVIESVNAQFGTTIKLYGNVPQLTVTNFIINGGNGIAVLQELFDKYLLNSFITTVKGEKVLYSGLTYGLKKGTVKHVLNRNTITIDDLKYQIGADKTYKILVVNFRNDGTVKTITFGDKKGIEVKLTVQGNKTDAELQHQADAEIAKWQTSSYKGSFVTFLTPYCEPGYVTAITDPQFPDRGGNYYIGSVLTTFGVQGGRRKPEIDIAV